MGQSMRWVEIVKALTIGLAYVDVVWLPGWSPRDLPEAMVGENRWYASALQSLSSLHSKPFFHFLYRFFTDISSSQYKGSLPMSLISLCNRKSPVPKMKNWQLFVIVYIIVVVVVLVLVIALKSLSVGYEFKLISNFVPCALAISS